MSDCEDLVGPYFRLGAYTLSPLPPRITRGIMPTDWLIRRSVVGNHGWLARLLARSLARSRPVSRKFRRVRRTYSRSFCLVRVLVLIHPALITPRDPHFFLFSLSLSSSCHDSASLSSSPSLASDIFRENSSQRPSECAACDGRLTYPTWYRITM